MHDGPLQLLMVAQQELAEAREVHGAALPALGAALEGAVAELRALTGTMHEETLQELPLSVAIGRIAHALSLRSDVRITVDVQPAVDGYNDAFLRETVRELLSNVVQHAHAAAAAVVLTAAGDDLVLEVTDDGLGFEPGAARIARADGHLGLQRVERTAARLSGSFGIVARSPRGTHAILRLPMAALGRRPDDLLLTADTAASSSHDIQRAAESRDAVAHSRDLSALERDREADAREVQSAARTVRLERDAAERRPNAGERERADERRTSAAEHEAAAGRDRRSSAEDRQVSARGRLHSTTDRNELLGRIAQTESDPLTGARTRGVGLRELAREVERSRRTGLGLVVAYVDVDGLKRVNDEQGHAAGDVLLVRVVAALRQHLRTYDLITRVGGDEFVCSLADAGLDAARARFATIEARLAIAPDAAFITVGLAALRPHESTAEVVARADAALAVQRRTKPLPRLAP
ncbi:hypothetical protein DSM112329_01943 [Paraconexibacter sp. AEG42_29]|uniref:GGDEF domain-containing protein n=1 Tax=Paraconexibacter sp. AEG42_29 TaxID=2997339 RepID=A0AAU7ATS3_9ACTN